MKKKIKKDQEVHTSAEVARYLGALSEEFQSRFQALSEITLGVDKKIDRVEHTQQSHTEMIGRVATDVEIIKGEIEIIKSGFRKKTDYDEFVLLERRVGILESRSRR